MIKKCPGCHKPVEMKSNQKYCNAKCKKTFENSQRSAQVKKPKSPLSGKNKTPSKPSKDNEGGLEYKATKPGSLNPIASAYWDKIAPTLEARGHLNILSEDAFAELCDLHSRLVDIRMMIDAGTSQECKKCHSEIIIPGNRSLLQIDDKWSVKDGAETQTFKESALSDLKRKYSKQFLDYCKAFYLTPLSNRGNFGLEDEENKDPEEEFLS
jgi:phage terminase small subunit